MVDAMFRRYGFAGVQVQIQAVLTLYSQGGQIFPPASSDARTSVPFHPSQANHPNGGCFSSIASSALQLHESVQAGKGQGRKLNCVIKEAQLCSKDDRGWIAGLTR